MTNKSVQKTTFWELINKKEIVIPKLQRDYVQGQKINTSIRHNFLNSIKSALDDPDSNYMILDFVYGMSDGEKFIPIDGQQRLTTLWLLHWYLALRCNKLPEYKEILGRFNYQTRPSTNRVFSKLLDINQDPTQSKEIAKYIKDQSWFHDEYTHDPTVESLLGMLGNSNDSIEQIFDGYTKEQLEKYLELLKNSEKCPIFFYLLEMKENGLSDDIYIKMNARGEMLDNLEKIKVDILDIMKNTDLYDRISDAFDNEWLLPFCPKKEEEIVSVDFDQLLYVFILRYYFSYYALKNITNELREKLYQTIIDDENVERYYSLSQFKVSSDESNNYLEFDSKFVESFYAFMEKYLMFFDSYTKSTGTSSNIWFLQKTKDMNFIPIFSENEKFIKPLTQIQMIVFCMLVKFFSESQENFDFKEECKKLKRWLRIVWNTVSIVDKYGDNGIRDISSMVSAIKNLKSLDSHNVYSSIVDQKTNIELNANLTAFEKSILQEGIKADQISKDESWEEKILSVEGLNNLEGDISFLYFNAAGEVDWRDFEAKLTNYKNYFSKSSENRFSSFICCFSEERLQSLNDLNIFLWEDKNLLSWRCMLNSPVMRPEVHCFLTNKETEQKELHKRIIAAYKIKRARANDDNALYKDNVFLKYDDNGFYVYRYYGHSSKLLSIQGGPIGFALTLIEKEYLKNTPFEDDNVELFIDYRNAYIDSQNGKFILTSNSLKKCNDKWEIIGDDVICKSDHPNWYEACKEIITSAENNQ